jgi:hypothetical protein
MKIDIEGAKRRVKERDNAAAEKAKEEVERLKDKI